MDKYGCFMQMYVYYYWNHSQQSMKSRHVSKVIDVFQRTCSCLLDTWKKEIPGSHYFSSLHWAIYLHKLVYIFAHRAALLLKMQNVHLLLHLFPSLCPHTVFWWSKILNKTVFIGIFYCFCCQTTEWIWNSDWNVTH